MSYSAPKHWGHGDIPASADMQTYSDDLSALHDIFGDQMFNWPTQYLGGGGAHTMRHQFRWLVYDDNGSIIDPTEVGETVVLDDPGGVAFYDLNTVEWLAPGMVYRLEEFDWALEVELRVITT